MSMDTVPDRKNHTLLKLTDSDLWTEGDSFEGVQIFGTTGSGKTSGSGKAIALSMLRAGYGGLVLCAKNDELRNWIRYGIDTKRLPDIRIYGLKGDGPDQERRSRMEGDRDALQALAQVPVVDNFSFMDYSKRRAPKGVSTTLDLVAVFLAALSSGESAVSGSDPYWNDTLRELLTHAIDLADMADAPVNLQTLVRIIQTAPLSIADSVIRLERADRANGPVTREDANYCIRLLREADARVSNAGRREDLRDTAHFWMHDFPNLSARTRSIIVSSFTAKVTGLLRSPLRRLTDTPDEATSGGRPGPIDPEQTHQGKIVVVDLPIKDLGEVGRLAQIIFKTVWQRSTERRSLQDEWKPVFLWADESQYFVTPYDALFQQTARSKCSATVYLTQNLPNYYSAMPGKDNRAAAESLIGNLQTKVFHANGDPATNEFAERIFGREPMTETGYGFSDGKFNLNMNPMDQPIVRTSRFTGLRTGGAHNERRVDALIFQAGRSWNEGSQYATGIAVSFDQASGTVVKQRGRVP